MLFDQSHFSVFLLVDAIIGIRGQGGGAGRGGGDVFKESGLLLVYN